MTMEYSLAELNEVVPIIWQAGKDYKVWTFNASMGAGKTTFIKALCEYLGVDTSVSSPTYSIINEYDSKTAGIIYHMDWYRLKSEQEALDAGVEECLYSQQLCLVEWSQNALGLLPENTFNITIKLIDEQTRELSFAIAT